jgi:hypothetical protein
LRQVQLIEVKLGLSHGERQEGRPMPQMHVKVCLVGKKDAEMDVFDSREQFESLSECSLDSGRQK